MRSLPPALSLLAIVAIGIPLGCTAHRPPPPGLVARVTQVESPDPTADGPSDEAETEPTGESAVESVGAEASGPEDSDDPYAELARQRLVYEAGIDWILSGEEVLGEEAVTTASRGLREAATRCAARPGCDLDRFNQALHDLLDRQWAVLKAQVLEAGRLADAIEGPPEEEESDSPVIGAIPEVGETVSLLRGTDLRSLIVLNNPVKAALDDWLTWLRPQFMEAYENYQFLREEIAPIYEQAGLPEALLFAMMATESGGKVHAHSRAGAAGPLQFIRSTGRRYGLGIVDGFDLRYDPVASTRANVAYLNDLFGMLNNSLEKALAAYNGGEARVQGLQRKLGGRSLWEGDFYFSLPRETREYVPRILAAAWLFLHPDEYNLELPAVDGTKTTLEVRRETSLSELSICLGQAGNPNGWFRILRNLNPRLDPGDAIEAGAEIHVPARLIPVYEEQCTGGELVERARELHEANYPDEPELIVYRVRRGDTLGRIADRHRCVSMRELAAINGIRPPRYTIRVGQRLKIPSCP